MGKIPLKIKVTMSHTELMALYSMMNRFEFQLESNLYRFAMSEFLIKKHFVFERKLVTRRKQYSFTLDAIDAFFFSMYCQICVCKGAYETNVILRLANLIDQRTA